MSHHAAFARISGMPMKPLVRQLVRVSAPLAALKVISREISSSGTSAGTVAVAARREAWQAIWGCDGKYYLCGGTESSRSSICRALVR